MLLAQNEALPADLLKRIVVQAASGWGGRQAQAHALQNKSFPLDMLAELALHGKELVREAVASCTRTPLAVIEQLMHDKCVAVKTEAKTTYERHKEKEEV